MIQTYEEKHYKSVHKRFIVSILEQFLFKNVPQVGGQELRIILSQKILELVDVHMPDIQKVKPGQMVWTTVDKHTRADSKKVKLNPVILTLVDENDVIRAETAEKTLPQSTPEVIARITKEAYQQGSLLSMRDIGIILKRAPSTISTFRIQYEEEKGVVLPTVATLQDVGSGITHKAMILRKILIEQKDMKKVRDETNHTQNAIDRYLKDYRRVEILLNDNKSITFISQVTGMQKFLIVQYKEIYNDYKKQPLTV